MPVTVRRFVTGRGDRDRLTICGHEDGLARGNATSSFMLFFGLSPRFPSQILLSVECGSRRRHVIRNGKLGTSIKL